MHSGVPPDACHTAHRYPLTDSPESPPPSVLIDRAKYIHKEYLTGTVITIIVVLLVALRGEGRKLLRRCPICDHPLLGAGKYCSDCGSKV